MNLIALVLAAILLIGAAWLEGLHTRAMSRRRRNNKPDKENLP